MMKAADRRKLIADMLNTATTPISGKMLSERFGVSRQIIVQDISALKESGQEIISSHNGYLMYNLPEVERVFKVRHTPGDTEAELSVIVDLGGTVVDVYVWHKVYGKLSAQLNIFSHTHIDKFMEGVRTGKSTELMNITGGYHYHTVRAESEEILDKIEKALNDKGFIAPII